MSIGRPKKYDERLIQKTVSIRESLLNKLEEELEVSFTEYLNDLIERDLIGSR